MVYNLNIGTLYRVYENEWTDAFLNLNDMKSDDGACINEEEAIAILLNILNHQISYRLD
jgi:hypothetical protein